jgi:hypothetical protein
MPCESGGLRFVFTELNRSNRPCLNLDSASDLLLLTDALEFSNENCIQLDGCCSSRVIASLSALRDPSSITTPDGFETVSDRQAAFTSLVGVLCPTGAVNTCSCS